MALEQLLVLVSELVGVQFDLVVESFAALVALVGGLLLSLIKFVIKIQWNLLDEVMFLLPAVHRDNLDVLPLWADVLLKLG